MDPFLSPFRLDFSSYRDKSSIHYYWRYQDEASQHLKNSWMKKGQHKSTKVSERSMLTADVGDDQDKQEDKAMEVEDALVLQTAAATGLKVTELSPSFNAIPKKKNLNLYLNNYSHDSYHLVFPQAPAGLKVMEATGDIEAGSMARLRKEAKARRMHAYKSAELLANALSPCVCLEKFLPKSSPGDDAGMDALLLKPILVCCCDEERRQFPRCKNCMIDGLFFLWGESSNSTRVKWWVMDKQPRLNQVRHCHSIFWNLTSPKLMWFTQLRVKWINQLLYAIKIRGCRRQDYHHRSSNDAKLGIQHSGFWGHSLCQ